MHLPDLDGRASRCPRTNLINVVNQYSYILILAIGMVMVIITGHIDLSVGSVAAFTGIIVAVVMRDWNCPWSARDPARPRRSASLIGAWQGFWVAFVGVPAFIVTLAGMLIFRGGNQFIGESTTIPVPQEFRHDRRRLPARARPNTGFNNLTHAPRRAQRRVVIFNEIRRRRNAR